jgi:hypothetical protein
LTVSSLEKQGYKSYTAFNLRNAVDGVGTERKVVEIEINSLAKRTLKLDEQSFFEAAVKDLDKEQLNGLWQVYNYCNKQGEIVWGTKSFNAVFPKLLDKSLFSVYFNGELQLYYGYLSEEHKSVDSLSSVKELAPILSIKRALRCART